MIKTTLRNALSVLSKSSPYSVKTVSDRTQDAYDELKNWLYIEQEIERDLRECLSKAKSRDMLFLCGSSGDGKSEILARAYHELRDKVRFHLDATHSFQPSQSAIEALDEVFRETKQKGETLVLGINIGMIGNYVQEGSTEHNDVKSAMQTFLEKGKTEPPYYFFNFESYPKFQFDDSLAPKAYFAKQVMQRLTQPSDANPFYALFKQGDISDNDPILFANYSLLMKEGVQDVIITNITKARLVKDQFMTARALLDFLHHLVTGPGYLFDNLFAGGDNELAERIAAFDPALLRTRELDQLVLRYELRLAEPERDQFRSQLSQFKIILSDNGEGASASFIRLLYVLQGESFGNDYHRRFKEEFTDKLLHDYANVWRLHVRFDGKPEMRNELRKFYANVLSSGIFRYANRNAPELEKGEILLGEFNGVKVAAPADLRADYDALANISSSMNIARFNVTLKVGEAPLKPIPFNINLFSLLVKLNQGYRPNKYDKNAVVLLEEIVEQIKAEVKCTDRLKLYRQQKPITLRDDDGMIETLGVV